MQHAKIIRSFNLGRRHEAENNTLFLFASSSFNNTRQIFKMMILIII